MAQGLNQGLRDVGNLCWKLSDVLAGRADPQLLDSYDEERRPNARAVIELTKAFGRLICERDPVAAAERDRRLLGEMHAGRGEIVRQDLLPPLTSGFLLAEADGGYTPGAGTIFPQPWVTNGAARLRMDDAFPHRYLLVVASDREVVPEALALAERLGVTIAAIGSGRTNPHVVEICEDGDLISAWMRRYAITAVLVRPDHVVFGSADVPTGAQDLLLALADGLAQGGGFSETAGPAIAGVL